MFRLWPQLDIERWFNFSDQTTNQVVLRTLLPIPDSAPMTINVCASTVFDYQKIHCREFAGLPRPVYLVLIASALAFFVAPVIFLLNLYYCLAVIRKDDRTFYPSVFATWFGWLSFIVFTGMSMILILQRLFGIALFTS